MSWLTFRINVLIMLVFVMSFFFACRYKAPSDAVDGKFEIWEIELAGNTKGKLTMTLGRKKIGEDKYSISGKMSGTIKDYRWGIGDADYKFKGKINNKFI